MMNSFLLLLLLLVVVVLSSTVIVALEEQQCDSIEEQQVEQESDSIEEDDNKWGEALELVLAKEIEQVNRVIEGYEKRLELLSTLRNEIVNMKGEPGKLEHMIKLLRRNDGAVFEQQQQQQPLLLFENHFVLKYDHVKKQDEAAIVDTGLMLIPVRPRAARTISDQAGYSGALGLLCTLRSDGSLEMVDTQTGKTALKTSLVDNGEIPNRLLVHGSVSPLVYAVTPSGHVSRFNVTAFIGGFRIAGWKSKSSVDPKEGSSEIQVEMEFNFRFSLCEDDASCKKVGHTNIIASRGNAISFISFADQKLSLFKHAQQSSSLMESLTLDEDQTVTVAISNGNQMAYSNGLTVHVTSTSTLKTLRVCDGVLHAKIIDMAYDVLMPMFLFAATDSGEVLIFNTRARPQGGGTTRCSLVSKIALHAIIQTDENLHVAVATQTGYLLSAVGDVVVVHNTTGIIKRNPTLLFAGKLGKENVDPNRRPILQTLQVTEKLRGTDYIMFVAVPGLDNGYLLQSVYQPLLPYKEPQQEFNWVRGPLIFATLVVVFIWQFSRNRTQQRQKHGVFGRGGGFPGMMGGGGPGGPGGRDFDFGQMDPDLKKFLDRGGMKFK